MNIDWKDIRIGLAACFGYNVSYLIVLIAVIYITLTIATSPLSSSIMFKMAQDNFYGWTQTILIGTFLMIWTLDKWRIRARETYKSLREDVKK